MYSFHQEKSNTTIPPEEIAKLLRSIGASGRLVGFNYVVYIVYNILQKPDEHYWITKCAYPDTAKYFQVRPASVEHAIRTVIASCWIAMTILTLTALQELSWKTCLQTASL